MPIKGEEIKAARRKRKRRIMLNLTEDEYQAVSKIRKEGGMTWGEAYDTHVRHQLVNMFYPKLRTLPP
jgi:hypothetical protein